jgi:hypothetical protein
VRRIATVIGISSVLVGLAGVSTAAVQAAGTSKHYTACATKGGTLSLEKKGKCAKHTSKVRLDVAGPRGKTGSRGKTGARGPAGPGSVTTTFELAGGSSPGTGPAVGTGIPGVTVQPACDGTDTKINIDGAGTYTVQGGVTVVSSGDGTAAYELVGGATTVSFDPGAGILISTNTVSGSAHLAFDIDSHTSSLAAMTGQMVVTVKSLSFTLQFSMGSSAQACDVTAVVTPTTTVKAAA